MSEKEPNRTQLDSMAACADNLEFIRILKTDSRYPEARKILTPRITETLKGITRFCADHPPMIENEKTFYVITTGTITQIRGKNRRDVANHYINLLCAAGFFEKIRQGGNPLMANRIFKEENPEEDYFPMSAFIVYPLTEERRTFIEGRARQLNAVEITAGNISCDTLLANGLTALAEEVYPNNDKALFTLKLKQYERLLSVIDSLIEQKGYCHKSETFERMRPLDNKQINTLFKNFWFPLKQRYKYGVLRAEEKRSLGLDPAFKKPVYTAARSESGAPQEKEKEIIKQ